MEKQRRRPVIKPSPAKRNRAKPGTPPGGGREAHVVDPAGLPAPADTATMVADGNRPHETTLHDTTLEDFGLDMLPVIQPHRP
jgi:hypothetical protein